MYKNTKGLFIFVTEIILLGFCFCFYLHNDANSGAI